MDRTKLIALIVEKTGVKLDQNDPAFVLVELNKAILEDASEKIAANLTDAAKKFEVTTTTNVDNFVDVANEALAKFITKTKELTAAINATNSKTSTANSVTKNHTQNNDPLQTQANSKIWLIPIGLFSCFLAGTLFGVTLTLFAQH